MTGTLDLSKQQLKDKKSRARESTCSIIVMLKYLSPSQMRRLSVSPRVLISST